MLVAGFYDWNHKNTLKRAYLVFYFCWFVAISLPLALLSSLARYLFHSGNIYSTIDLLCVINSVKIAAHNLTAYLKCLLYFAYMRGRIKFLKWMCIHVKLIFRGRLHFNDSVENKKLVATFIIWFEICDYRKNATWL